MKKNLLTIVNTPHGEFEIRMNNMEVFSKTDLGFNTERAIVFCDSLEVRERNENEKE